MSDKNREILTRVLERVRLTAEELCMVLMQPSAGEKITLYFELLSLKNAGAVTHYQVAEAAGVCRESVSREIRKMRSQGFWVQKVKNKGWVARSKAL